MNSNGLAYSSLLMLVEDWAAEQDGLVKYPHIFARHVADFAFNDLLEIDDSEIDFEDPNP